MKKSGFSLEGIIEAALAATLGAFGTLNRSTIAASVCACDQSWLTDLVAADLR